MENNTLKNAPAGANNDKTNKRLLLLEKTLFITAVAIGQFYLTLVLTDMQWIASPNILLFIAPPFVIAGIVVRMKRKNRLKKIA